MTSYCFKPFTPLKCLTVPLWHLTLLSACVVHDIKFILLKYVQCFYFLSQVLFDKAFLRVTDKDPTLEVVNKDVSEKVKFRPKFQECVGIYQWRWGKIL